VVSQMKRCRERMSERWRGLDRVKRSGSARAIETLCWHSEVQDEDYAAAGERRVAVGSLCLFPLSQFSTL